MTDKLSEIIKHYSEGVALDFKSNEYPLGKHAKKNELLKDISAMANHPSNDPKYIIIGVKAKDGLASEFFNIESLTDQSKYEQFISEYIEPNIHFEYLSFIYEDYKLAAFVISNNHERPYLFKKNAQNPTDQTVEFKEGDGFIRAGTSTRKLNRKDFEEIFLKRNDLKDRQGDLNITPIIKEYSGFATEGVYPCYIIDFLIANLSTKSIAFDAELKLFYSSNAIYFKKFTLEERNRERGLQAIYPQHFKPVLDTTILDLKFEKNHDYLSVSTVGRNGKHGINISQKDSEKNIFLNEIIIGKLMNSSGNCIVKMELLLRCDDFRDGPLMKKFEFDLNQWPNV